MKPPGEQRSRNPSLLTQKRKGVRRGLSWCPSPKVLLSPGPTSGRPAGGVVGRREPAGRWEGAGGRWRREAALPHHEECFSQDQSRSLPCRAGRETFFTLHYGSVPLPRAKSGLQRRCCPGQGLPGYPAGHSLSHTLGPWHHLTSEQGEAPRAGEGPEQVGAWAGATGAEGKPGGEVQSPRPLRRGDGRRDRTCPSPGLKGDKEAWPGQSRCPAVRTLFLSNP